MTMLFTPGPVKVLEEIRNAQAAEMWSHREQRWADLFEELIERFKKYGNAEEGYLVTGSGTLANEMNMLNAVKKTDKMLLLSNGGFGQRLHECAQVYCDSVTMHEVESGKGWSLENAKSHIDQASENNTEVFAMVYNETSNGTLNHAKDICNYAKKKGMRTIVDGVSAWPATELDLKSFGIDFFGTASQKSLGAPPGIGMVLVGKDGAEFNKSREDKLPGFYADMRLHRKFYENKKQTPWTPAVSVYFALKRSFDTLDKNGGINGCIKRHKEASKYSRKRVIEMGLEPVPPEEHASNTITAFWKDNARELKKQMRKEFDIEIAVGNKDLKDKVIRICHLGNFTQQELELVINNLEELIKKN